VSEVGRGRLLALDLGDAPGWVVRGRHGDAVRVGRRRAPVRLVVGVRRRLVARTIHKFSRLMARRAARRCLRLELFEASTSRPSTSHPNFASAFPAILRTIQESSANDATSGSITRRSPSLPRPLAASARKGAWSSP
jgi:hypothetical protein